MVRAKMTLIKDSAGFEYDLFLAGPWEQYSKEKYKTMFKQVFPSKRFYDPEARPSQANNSWFEDNYHAIKNSERMVAFVPDLPFPGNAQEAGMFYLFQREKGIYAPDHLIVIWNEIVKPEFGLQVVSRYPSTIFRTTREAISFLDDIYKK